MTEIKNTFKKNNSGKPLTFHVILGLCCFLLAGTGFGCFGMRNGVQAKTGQNGSILQSTGAVSSGQDDEESAGEEQGEPENPVDVYDGVSADIINACLSQGHHPIAGVQGSESGNIRHVLIIGVKDGKYQCMDPLRAGITELSDYGNRVYAVRCMYCGDLDLPGDEEADIAENAESGENTEDVDTETAENAESTEVAETPTEKILLNTDLNRNGVQEELRVMATKAGEWLEVWEKDERLWWDAGAYAHTGANAVFLYRQKEKDYLLRYRTTMYQGFSDYSYELFTIGEEGETITQWDAVSFDINFGSPLHESFEAEAIASFMDKINGLLVDSVELINTDSNLLKTFKKEGAQTDTLWWLDSEETGYTRDASRSLLENLKDFQKTLTEEGITLSKSYDALPFEDEAELVLDDGTGGRTTLLLNPDGTFTGDYVKTDMLAMQLKYPKGTRYVCEFHGKLGEMTRTGNASFSLALEELVIDTEYPAGEEWIEEGVRCISDEPHGFGEKEGTVLEAGASFMFYMPEAIGHEPETELYDAAEFLNWLPEHREFLSESDKLGRYGLRNLETGYGFFSEEIAE